MRDKQLNYIIYYNTTGDTTLQHTKVYSAMSHAIPSFTHCTPTTLQKPKNRIRGKIKMGIQNTSSKWQYLFQVIH
jgi:hypothetical protein